MILVCRPLVSIEKSGIVQGSANLSEATFFGNWPSFSFWSVAKFFSLSDLPWVLRSS